MHRAAEVERWRQRAARPYGIFSFILFAWVNPVLRKGGRNPLEQDDLLQLAPLHQPAVNQARLWDFWAQEFDQHPLEPQLLRVIYRAYGARYFAIAGLKLLNDALNFVGPLLLNILVSYLSGPVSQTSSPPNTPHSHPGPTTAHLQSKQHWWNGLVAEVHSCWLAFSASWDPRGPWLGYWCAALLMLACVLKAFLNTHYNYQLSVLSNRLRSALMCSLYRKALMLRGADLDARLHTLMAVDTSASVNLLLSFHELWSLPLQIVVAFYLLFVQVRYCFLAGVAVCILMIPINRWIALRIQAASVRMMKHKDARITTMSELLRGIRAIKMMAWEDMLAKKVEHHRAAELSALSMRKYLDALCVYFWVATSSLFSLFTFGLMVLLGQPLTPAVVFTSLALFNILITPLNAFPWVINGVMEALVSLGRLRGYLQQPASHPLTDQLSISEAAGVLQREPSTGEGSGGSSSSGNLARTSSGRASPSTPSMPRMKDPDKSWIIRVVAAQLEGACFAWSREAGPICLQDISLSIMSGVLTTLVGQVGSGKSSLLAALMGELPLVKGLCTVRPGKVGYVSQNPWLISGTVKDNIILGQPFNEQLYFEVLSACALDQDLMQLAYGDDTHVGDRGSTLSGGQRVRVALARVLYQRCDLFLLDDILAAVDQHCAAWIVQNVLTGPLLEYRTVVVSTKSVPCIRASQYVIRLDRGRVAFAGSSRQFLEEHGETVLVPGSPSYTDDDHDFIIKCDATSERSDGVDSLCGTVSSGREEREPQPMRPGVPTHDGSLAKLMDKEEREIGRVKLHVYCRYFKAVGCGLVAAVALCLLLMQLTRNGNDLWLSFWVSRPQCCSPTAAPGQLAACHTKHHFAAPNTPTHTSSSHTHTRRSPPSMPNQPRNTRHTHTDTNTEPTTTNNTNTRTKTNFHTHPRPHPTQPSAPHHRPTFHPRLHPHPPAQPSTPATSCSPFSLLASETALNRNCRRPGTTHTQQLVWSPHACRRLTSGPGNSTNLGPLALVWGSAPVFRGSPVGHAMLLRQVDAMLDQPLWWFSTLTSTAGSTVDGDDDVGVGVTVETAQGATNPTESVNAQAIDFGAEEGLGNGSEEGVSKVMYQLMKAVVGGGVDDVGDDGNGAAIGGALEKASLEKAHGGAHKEGSVLRQYRRMLAAVDLNARKTEKLNSTAEDSEQLKSAAHEAEQLKSITNVEETELVKPNAHGAEQLESIAREPEQLVTHNNGGLRQEGEKDEVEKDEVEKDEVEKHEVEKHEVEKHEVEKNEVDKDGVERDGIANVADSVEGSGGDERDQAGSEVHHPTATEAVASVQHHSGHHSDDGPATGAIMDPEMSIFFRGLLVIAALNTVFTMGRAFSFAFAGLQAASHLHSQLLGAVLCLPMRFFDQLPVGRIINRFSSDVNTVDDSLPFMLNILLANAVALLGALGLMATAQPLMLAALVPLTLLYRYIQLHYQSSAREIRRLDSVTLSPIYTSFAEVLEGSACIRGLQLQRHFANANTAAVAANQQAAITAAVTSNWLSLRLQLLAAILVGVVALLGAAAKQGLLPVGYRSWDAGLVGLSLSYALPIVSLLNGLLTSSAETEQEMVAVERICQYLDLPPQPNVLPTTTEPGILSSGTHSSAEQVVVDPGSAPRTAILELQDVYLHYAPSLPWALRGVDFIILPGQKVGICGRTGAGKSSVMACILRLAEIHHGAVLLRGRDVRTIPLKTLRASLGVVPQAPFLFHGSVRENLDPLGRFSDEVLKRVLQDVQMWTPLVEAVQREGLAVILSPEPVLSSPAFSDRTLCRLAAHPHNDPYASSLTTPLLATPSAATHLPVLSSDPLTTATLNQILTPGGKTLSHGQRQLLCLARVLLKQSDLILLDECTAGMDNKTSAVMRGVLSERVGVAGAVLQVAHDLDAIMGYDLVMLMDGGQVVERGPPKQLLSQRGTHFSGLWRSACC